MSSRSWRFMGWQRDIMRFFRPYATPERPFLAVLALLSLIMIFTNTVLIWNVGKAITQITESQFDAVQTTLILIASLVLLNMVIKFIYSYTYQRITLRFVDRVRGSLLSKIMQISFPINSKFDKGDLIARLSGDVDRLLTYVFNVPLNIVANSVVLSVYASMAFWINWELSLIALTMAPLFYLSQQYIGPKTGIASRHFTQEKAKLISLEDQTLRNLRGISAFNSESNMRELHRQQFEIARNWALKVRMIGILYNSLFTILLYLVAAVILYFGISSIQSGQLTIGVFVSFLVYIRFLTNPVRSIARMPIQMQTNRVAADRIMEIMNMHPGVVDSESPNTLNVQKGQISYQNVTFTYPGNNKPVFTNLSFEINPGESIALVGRSGSGKSTFASLLLRFYDPQQGNIFIDGIDIKTVSLASLREQISIVWQNPLIINGTIRENLLLAKPGASEDQLISACKNGHCWEFIEKLEDGIDTRIGTHGTDLSIGQIQRIAITQAFLRNSPILILDEASAALDSHSEQMIVSALQSLRKNRTTLMIAHRFSSIRSANRILYFNLDGSFTSGTHEQLSKQHADYRESVEWQTGKINN